MKSQSEEIPESEADKRSDAVLKRLLSTPPQPKPKKDASASPKKRGRPVKEKREPEGSRRGSNEKAD